MTLDVPAGRAPRPSPAAGLAEDRLPFAPDAERSVLGSILYEPALYGVATQHVRAEHFHREAHRLIFEAMSELAEKNEAPDYTALVETLRARKELEAVGGETMLMGLLDAVGTPGLLDQYAAIVRDRAVSRRMIRAAQDVVQAGLSGEYASSGDYLGFAEARLHDAIKNASRGSVLDVREVLRETLDKIERLCAQDHELTGLSTGFRELDALTLGMHGGELIVVAGRPGMGKTALAMNMAAHVALHEQKAVLIYSLEMSPEQLGMRLLAQEGRVDLRKIRGGHLDAERDLPKLYKATARLKDARIHLDTTPSVTVMDIRATARRLAMEGRCDLVMLDYLQLTQGRKGIDSREQMVADVSRNLKHLALELDIPVMALSQLNRSVESRPKKRPQMADLRESGAIEQDADVILFIYREEFYDPETERKGLADLILSKQRNGPTGTIEVRFTPEITRFDNVETGYVGSDLGVRIGGVETPPAAAELPPPPEPADGPYAEEDIPF